jgi:hypothetical protein
MKKLMFATGALAVLVGVNSIPALGAESPMSHKMVCAALRGDQAAYTRAAFAYNVSRDIKVPLAMPTLSAEVAQSVRQFGGC